MLESLADPASPQRGRSSVPFPLWILLAAVFAPLGYLSCGGCVGVLGVVLALFGAAFHSRVIFCTALGILLGQFTYTPLRFNLADEVRSLILWPLAGVIVGVLADAARRLQR